MKTSDELKADFTADLKALLKKYDAELELITSGDYGYFMNVFSNAQYNDDHDMIKNTMDFNLPIFMDGK